MPDPYKKYPGLATQDRVEAAKRRTSERSQSPDMMSQLEQMLSQMSFGGSPDMGAMSSYLQKAVSGEYDPQINSLRNDMGQAKKRAGAAKKDIGGMYEALRGYYEGQKKPTKANYASSKSEAKNRSEGLKDSITEDYTNRLKEQVEMYKSLGIEEAAPSATEGQTEDQANALATADNTGGAEMAALNQQEAGDLSYWSEGAGAAKTEGTEIQGDITTQLNDYLNRQGGALNQLMGAKESAYNQGMMQMEQQAASSASQQQNQLWSRMMELARLKQSGSGSTPNKGMLGAASMLGDPGQANLFQQLMNEGSQWRTSDQAKLNYGGHSPTSPEEWARMIKDAAANRGMTPEQQQQMWLATLTYFGRR